MSSSDLSTDTANEEAQNSAGEFPDDNDTPPKETIPTGQGGFPWIIRYLIHFIILWSVGYVLIQPESNYINYITAALLVMWSAYNLLAMRKKWPPFP